MRARDRFRVIHRRSGPEPAFLAPRHRIDHVEVVDDEQGEVTFFWDLPAREAGRLVRALREDLGVMDDGDFVAAWEQAAEEGRRR